MYSILCILEFNIIFAPTNKAGALAQLVEQRTENPCVPGSIPGGTTLKRAIAKVIALLFLSTLMIQINV